MIIMVINLDYPFLGLLKIPKVRIIIKDIVSVGPIIITIILLVPIIIIMK